MEAIRRSRQPITKTDDLLRFLIRPDRGLCPRVRTDAPARWNELETARSNALSGHTPRRGDAQAGVRSNRARAALFAGAASLQQSRMQPHEGQDRKPDPDERERQRQRTMSVRLLLVIAVLLGLLTPLLLKRFFF